MIDWKDITPEQADATSPEDKAALADRMVVDTRDMLVRAFAIQREAYAAAGIDWDAFAARLLINSTAEEVPAQ